MLIAMGACVATPASAAASGAERLVLQPFDVPGLTPGHASRAAARQTVARLIARRGARRVRVDAARYRRGRRGGAIRLGVEAYVLSSSRVARRALRAWTRMTGVRRYGLRGARAGQGGFVGSRTRRGQTVAVLALRKSSAVAVLRLELPAAGAAARRLALSYGTLEAARLGRVLARTAWDRVLASVGRTGVASNTAVLQMFSLAYGRIPGVRLPPGSRRFPLVSGSWFVQRILQDLWPRLTRAQRRAVGRALWPPRGRHRARARAAAGILDGCLDQVGGLTLDVAATDDARVLRAAEQAHMPYATTTFEVCAYVAPQGGITLANTSAWYRNRGDAPNDGSQRTARCRTNASCACTTVGAA